MFPLTIVTTICIPNDFTGKDCRSAGYSVKVLVRVDVAKFATSTKHGAVEGKTQTHMVEYYNLDMIISVGYRMKSRRGNDRMIIEK